MSDTASGSSPKTLAWHQGVPRYAWLVLCIAALGWLFDTMDLNLFNLVAQRSIRDLLIGHVPEAELQNEVNAWRGYITSVFLLGWAAGGGSEGCFYGNAAAAATQDGRRTSPVARSRMVVGLRAPPVSPATRPSIRSPSRRRTASAVRAGG